MPLKKKRKSVSKKGKKKGSTKKKTSPKKAKASAATTTAAPQAPQPAPQGYGFAKVHIMLATFASKPHYPCHFHRVFRLDSPIKFLIDAIKQQHDGTIQNPCVFQGELRGSDVMQTSDTIEPDTTLHELGIEGTSLQEADGTPLEEAEVLFYDYSPDVQDLTATALVTQDEYFLKNILVPSQYSKDKTGKGGDASRTAGAGRRRQPSAAS